jgi:hypothetical protein
MMSKKILITAAVFLSLLLVPLEAHADLQYRWGVKGALTISAQPGSGLDNSTGYALSSENKMGFSLGAFLGFDLTSRLRLQPEIIFTRKGSKKILSSNLNPLVNAKANYTLDYLEIPLLLKAYLGMNREPIGFYLGFGSYIAFLINDKYTLKAGQDEIAIDDLQGLKSTDYGIIAAIGLDISGADVDFGFNYRLSMGLAELELFVAPQFPDLSVRNITHAFTLDIIF